MKLVNKLSTYVTWMFSVVITKGCRWNLYWNSQKDLKPSHTVYLKLVLILSFHLHLEPGSLVSIVYDYGLDNRAIGVRSPVGAKDFSSNLCVQTSSEAHPASCAMGTGGPFPGAKSGRGVTLTTHPLLMARPRMSRSYASSPQAPPWSIAALLYVFRQIILWCSELSSGIYCRVKLLSTDVSEVRTASIIRDKSVYPRRQLWTSYSPPWELEISQIILCF
jgi:hypothetical protein